MAVSMAAVREHALGRDARTTVGFVAAAVALGAAPVVVFLAPAFESFRPTALTFVAFAAVGFVLAGVNAYLNRGLLATVLLAWGGVLPFWVPYAFTDAPIGREPTLESAAGTLLLGPAIPAVVVGLVAYAVGVGVHRLQVRAAE